MDYSFMLPVLPKILAFFMWTPSQLNVQALQRCAGTPCSMIRNHVCFAVLDVGCMHRKAQRRMALNLPIRSLHARAMYMCRKGPLPLLKRRGRAWKLSWEPFPPAWQRIGRSSAACKGMGRLLQTSLWWKSEQPGKLLLKHA